MDMFTDKIEFDTPWGPATVVYHGPNQWETRSPEFSMCTVQCRGHIVWDRSTGKWYPEPYVVDHVLPRARAVCQLLGIPAYDWLKNLRRGDVWAIERPFTMNMPVRYMMDYAHKDDYNATKHRLVKAGDQI